MNYTKYEQLTSNIKNNKSLVRFLNVADKIITYATVVLYVGFLIYAFYSDYSLFYRSVLVPAVSFTVVSIYRNYNHSRRPYEVYDFEPLIHKDTVEKSFPSRHVFSIFMISVTVLQVSVEGAVIISAFGIVLAILRVIGGVHFIRDVVAGAAIALLCGLLGYGIIIG